MNLASWFRTDAPNEADIRSEIWRLGTRHQGEPLDGALGELKAPGLTARRAALLRACVARLRAG
jgi:hypothetical protein